VRSARAPRARSPADCRSPLRDALLVLPASPSGTRARLRRVASRERARDHDDDRRRCDPRRGARCGGHLGREGLTRASGVAGDAQRLLTRSELAAYRPFRSPEGASTRSVPQGVGRGKPPWGSTSRERRGQVAEHRRRETATTISLSPSSCGPRPCSGTGRRLRRGPVAPGGSRRGARPPGDGERGGHSNTARHRGRCVANPSGACSCCSHEGYRCPSSADQENARRAASERGTRQVTDCGAAPTSWGRVRKRRRRPASCGTAPYSEPGRGRPSGSNRGGPFRCRAVDVQNVFELGEFHEPDKHR
jgi:hypothetical protein